ncbi:hypothetical protein L208DRAFT_1382453 [Tricholoma matsutake]|nr:hypothetical protein L208DRAFT_1382453 [Tricholoma matsutake 945]
MANDAWWKSYQKELLTDEPLPDIVARGMQTWRALTDTTIVEKWRMTDGIIMIDFMNTLDQVMGKETTECMWFKTSREEFTMYCDDVEGLFGLKTATENKESLFNTPETAACELAHFIMKYLNVFLQMECDIQKFNIQISACPSSQSPADLMALREAYASEQIDIYKLEKIPKMREAAKGRSMKNITFNNYILDCCGPHDWHESKNPAQDYPHMALISFIEPLLVKKYCKDLIAKSHSAQFLHDYSLINPLDPKWKAKFEPMELICKPVWTKEAKATKAAQAKQKALQDKQKACKNKTLQKNSCAASSDENEEDMDELDEEGKEGKEGSEGKGKGKGQEEEDEEDEEVEEGGENQNGQEEEHEHGNTVDEGAADVVDTARMSTTPPANQLSIQTCSQSVDKSILSWASLCPLNVINRHSSKRSTSGQMSQGIKWHQKPLYLPLHPFQLDDDDDELLNRPVIQGITLQGYNALLNYTHG